MAKKDMIDKIAEKSADAAAYNPLMSSLRANDKRNLFDQKSRSFFHKTGFPLFDYYFGSVINLHDDLGKIVAQEPRVGQAAGTFNMVIGNTGTGKALVNSAKIPVPDGYKLMGDLKVGDQVFGPDGKLTTVEGVFPQGKKQVYIVQCGTRQIKCSSDHLWAYSIRGKGANIKHGVCTTLELKEMTDDVPSARKRPWLPRLSAPVEFTPYPVSVSPYIVGRCIGDPELYRALVAELKGHTIDVKSNAVHEAALLLEQIPKGCGAVNVDALVGIIESAMDAEMIPTGYLYNTTDVRWELLAGIFDSNKVGAKDRRYHQSVYATVSKPSANMLCSIRDLISSLGIPVKLSYVKSPKKENILQLTTIGNLGVEFMGCAKFRGKLYNAISNAIFDNGHVTHTLTDIEHDIEQDDDFYQRCIVDTVATYQYEEEMTCIKVARPDGLFIAENYLVTHNTTLIVQIAANIIRPYKNGSVLHYDYEQRVDVSRIENVTQLPIQDFEEGGRYVLQQGMLDLESTQQAIVQIYVEKIRRRDELMIGTGQLDEFRKEIFILPPTVVILDSVANIIPDGFSVDNAKDITDAEKLRGNMAGARDAKTMRGFMRDIAPILKEANIIVYGINHINTSVQISMFSGPTKQMNFLKPEESIPGGKALFFGSYNLPKLVSKPSDDFTEATDGFNGHIVMIEPIKSSSNQSGNNSKGVAFELVFSYKHGFDSLRSLILYGKEKGIIDGTKPRFKFVDDPSFVFAWKNLDTEKLEKPIWDCVKKYIIPELNTHLSFVEPVEFDQRSMDY